MLREIEMKVTELIDPSNRAELERPLWFVETSYNPMGDAVAQKVTIVTKGDVECVCYIDYGDHIRTVDHRPFSSFMSMCRARHRRKEIRSKLLLRPEIYTQLERRLLENPSIPVEVIDEESELILDPDEG
jgi:hypothetical protein